MGAQAEINTDTVDSFLHPNSMLTPAMAGSITILIVNALVDSFSFEPRWTALTISFLIALVLLSKINISFLQKIAYLSLNGLVIFAFAMGANNGMLADSSIVKSRDSTNKILKEKRDRIDEQILGFVINTAYGNGKDELIIKYLGKNSPIYDDLIVCLSQENIEYIKQKDSILSGMKKNTGGLAANGGYDFLYSDYEKKIKRYVLSHVFECLPIKEKSKIMKIIGYEEISPDKQEALILKFFDAKNELEYVESLIDSRRSGKNSFFKRW